VAKQLQQLLQMVFYLYKIKKHVQTRVPTASEKKLAIPLAIRRPSLAMYGEAVCFTKTLISAGSIPPALLQHRIPFSSWCRRAGAQIADKAPPHQTTRGHTRKPARRA
jgi:hypothetical protein